MANLSIRHVLEDVNAIDGTCLLMPVHETGGKRTDIVYANGEAIAEIDANGNIYELHNDHLGTPRYITSRSTGKIAGEQAFGPYGEELVGNYNGQTLPTGYKPVTGYTGHLNEDLSGLIYMKGRYYSPLWHRFINSDQGVDPRSINQYAYVGGSPFMAKDPWGMEKRCLVIETWKRDQNSDAWYLAYVDVLDCWDDGRGNDRGDYGEVGGGPGPGNNNSKPGARDPLCDELEKLGLTGEDLSKMSEAFGIMNYGKPTRNGFNITAFEHGVFKDAADIYRWGEIDSNEIQKFQRGIYNYTYQTGFKFDIRNASVPIVAPAELYSGAFFFHGHFDGPNVRPNFPSPGDRKFASDWETFVHIFGSPAGLWEFDGKNKQNKLAGSEWWKIKC